MVGVSLLLQQGKLSRMTRAKAIEKMDKLLRDTAYFESISRATSDDKNVKGRINKFIRAFER